jgi:predicted CXXCH cytochrome family protein
MPEDQDSADLAPWSYDTAKGRAALIPYTYPRRRDPQIRRRLIAAGVMFGLTIGAVALGVMWPELGRRQVSHGPLTFSHSPWEARCDVCHPKASLNVVASEPIATSEGDRLCMACHMGHPEQAHHPRSERLDRVPHCAVCHRDHQGSHASLVRMDEAACLGCHGDLGRAIARTPQLPDNSWKIHHFWDSSHPAFSSTASDPGAIKFNHALHMTPGQRFEDPTAAAASERPRWTIGDLDPADRARYAPAGTDQSAPVRLACASCHRPEGETGAYLAPIRYELHCAACHPLQVAAQPQELKALPRRPAAVAQTIPVRHGQQVKELRDSLESAYVRVLLGEKEPALRESLDSGPIPGRRIATQKAQAEIDRRVATALRDLFGTGKRTCTECHYYVSQKRAGRLEGSEGTGVGSLVIADPGLRGIWFEHARFDHAAHRAIDCRPCHESAYPDAPGASGRPTKKPDGRWLLPNDQPTWTSHTDVLIPGKDVCAACHAPPGTVTMDIRGGGAGTSCTECHTYHNGDRPHEGRGANARAASSSRDIADFLQGRSDASIAAPVPSRGKGK